MKYNLRKLYKSVSLSLMIVTAWVVSAHAVDDVRVTNWPTSYSVVNTTWDSRLSTLQTTLQTLSADMSQFPTFVSRFGWNGTMSFSQGFELLYNDVHSLATSTSQSDILTAFNREFMSGVPADNSNSTKKYVRDIQLSLRSSSGIPFLYTINNTMFTNRDYLNHIDSDLHTSNAYLTNMDTSLVEIDGYTYSIFNLTNSNLPYIKVNTDNIAVDTQYINQYTSNLPAMASDLSTLQEFFADADSVRHKQAAQDTSNEALDDFTGNGSSSASVNDYSLINDTASSLQTGFGTGSVDPAGATDLINGNNQNAWAWFSQATYDSINPVPTRGGMLNAEIYMAFYEEQLASNSRKGSSDTPLLDGYYNDVNKAVGK